MERLGPDILRAYANALEDKRRLVNVEGCRRCPELDQSLLLALNGATGKRSGYKDRLPDAGTVAEWLRERLVEVSTSDKQSVILGLFYTAVDSIKRNPKLMIGVFPLYNNQVKYTIRPCEINVKWFKESGKANLLQESVTKKDPIEIFNPKGPIFLFFKRNPFGSDRPYRLTLLEEEKYWSEYEPVDYKMALEENFIQRVLANPNSHLKRRLFRQAGFAKFINSHCSDPKYVELHTAFTQRRFRK